MLFTQSDIEEIVINSCSQLQEDQPMLFEVVNDINERTVSGELSTLWANLFWDHHVNVEYNRMTDQNGVLIPKRIGRDPNNSNKSLVYPDIIVHKQEDANHNLLVVEIKMQWKNDNKEDDFVKLHGYIKELNYQFGIYLELGETGITDIVWFNRDNVDQA